MICQTCGAELLWSLFGPITEWGYVCRDDYNPTYEDLDNEGLHVVAPFTF
ncbi:hypothetical protein SEA_SEPHIROTH_78 [Gordonia Phage Sephiroth]|uniref:Uncharacterized protein n=1 Tax=Gordonia Phage Sephiroth TaxID=2767553 RepID=A0A7G9UZG3_9CAUD|nr:hypothetical protein L3Y23_gp078 [Gordonia Phage Sephiroth]QNN99418.1 hypothetical protein SEA_SEPHIROTH_78 [Gordonia Phage Sephiroth]